MHLERVGKSILLVFQKKDIMQWNVTGTNSMAASTLSADSIHDRNEGKGKMASFYVSPQRGEKSKKIG